MKRESKTETTAREIYTHAVRYWNKKKLGSLEQKTFDELPARFQVMYRWIARWHLREMARQPFIRQTIQKH